MTEYQIRPFQAEDLDIVLAAYERSPERRQAFACLMDRGERQTAPGSTLRLVAGNPAIAFLEVIDRSVTYHKPRCFPGVCDATLFLPPDYQKQRIDAALYERMISFAQERGAHTIRSHFYSHNVDFAAPPFLLEHGFIPDTKRSVMFLDLPTVDLGVFASGLRALEEQRIALSYYQDTPANRRRLYRLLHEIDNISEQLSFEEWSALEMDTADWNEEVLLIATREEGQWIGLCNAMLYNAEKGVASMPFGAVVPGYRQQGIATAFVGKNLEVLRQWGVQKVFGFTRLENTPAVKLAQNVGGYQGAIQHVYSKRLGLVSPGNAPG